MPATCLELAEPDGSSVARTHASARHTRRPDPQRALAARRIHLRGRFGLRPLPWRRLVARVGHARGWHDGCSMRPAVFLDRDGTLIREVGYLDRLDRLEMFPFSVDAVRLLNRAGRPVVVVSNQSGIGRGLIDPAAVESIHAFIGERMRDGGACIDAFLFCPHHPEAVLDDYRRVCECRKPAPGMLHQAARMMDLDLSRSVVVGDRWDDVRTARAAGARGVLVRTGYGADAERAPHPGIEADAVTDDLAGAVAWILGQA